MTTPEYGSLRSDDDHWDIVSNVGYTALLVAGWRALHTTGPKPLVQDEYAKHFITASADPYLEGLLANPRTSEDGTAFPRLYGVQTRFFDDFFNCADEAGIRQAVIVAAGLDCRAYRLDWQPGTTVFEIDVPKVDLEVDYPERLSRGLVLIKWWLLAIPHYLILAVFLSSGWRVFLIDPHDRVGIMWPSLLVILLLVAVVALLFTGRYPIGLYNLVIGVNRWALRVRAYTTLMRDEYPPLRLDMGPREQVSQPATAASDYSAGGAESP